MFKLHSATQRHSNDVKLKLIANPAVPMIISWCTFQDFQGPQWFSKIFQSPKIWSKNSRTSKDFPGHVGTRNLIIPVIPLIRNSIFSST